LELARGERIELALYDVTGRRVLALHDGFLPAGSHAFVWNGGMRAASPCLPDLLRPRHGNALSLVERLILLR